MKALNSMHRKTVVACVLLTRSLSAIFSQTLAAQTTKRGIRLDDAPKSETSQTAKATGYYALVTGNND